MHVLAVGDIPEPDPVPVSTPLAVDPSMAPSPVSPPHPPSEPTSPVSTASDESSDDDLGFPGFRNYDDQEHDGTTAAQEPDHNNPSTPSSFPSSSPKLPVSLPLDAPEWTQILATHPPWKLSSPNDLVRVVEEDSKRLRYQGVIDRLREYNRQANIADLPLVPIPNLDGLKAPLGYNEPITSVSQIKTLSTVELNAWLAHYGLSLSSDDSGHTRTRSLLATHLGLDAVLPA